MGNFFDTISKPQKALTYVKPNIDIFLCPTEFLSWLEKACEHNGGEYAQAVSSNCEYSCLWICGKLKDKLLQGDMQVCYGKFGFWEHYWISYTYKGREYFLDLTLAQFMKDAPRFAVTLAENSQDDTTYNDIYKESASNFFSRLQRDWDLIESGKAKELDEWFKNPNRHKNSFDDLTEAFRGLE
jgi:hypothetical protein